MRFRDRVTAAVDVTVEETADYEVSFADLGPLLARLEGKAEVAGDVCTPPHDRDEQRAIRLRLRNRRDEYLPWVRDSTGFRGLIGLVDEKRRRRS